MSSRKRAYFLVEMLATVFFVGIGLALIAGGLVGMTHTQRQAGRLVNRYTVHEDFLDQLRADVRRSTATALEEAADKASAVLHLESPAGRTSYVVREGSVERLTFEGDAVSPKQWDLPVIEVRFTLLPVAEGPAILHVESAWHSMVGDESIPPRIFELNLRSLGERHDP